MKIKTREQVFHTHRWLPLILFLGSVLFGAAFGFVGGVEVLVENDRRGIEGYADELYFDHIFCAWGAVMHAICPGLLLGWLLTTTD